MGDTHGVIPLSDVRPFRSSSPLSDALDSSALRSDPQQPPLSEMVRGPVVGFEHSGEASRENTIENESSMSISSSSGTVVDEAGGHPVSSDVAAAAAAGAGSGERSKVFTSNGVFPLAVSTETNIDSTGIVSQGDTMQHNRGSAGASVGSMEGRRVSVDNMASANMMEGVSAAAEEHGSRFDSQKVSSGSSTANLLMAQGDAHLASIVSGATMSSVIPGAPPAEGASRSSDIAGGGLALHQQSVPQQQPLASKTATEMRDHRLEEGHKIGDGVGARNGVSDDFPGGAAARSPSPITVVGSTKMEARVVGNDAMAAAASGVSVASAPERSSEDGRVFESNGRNIAPRLLPDRSDVSRQGGGDKAPHLAILSRGSGTSRNRPAPAPGQGMGYGMPGGFGPFKFNIPTTAPAAAAAAAATLNP